MEESEAKAQLGWLVLNINEAGTQGFHEKSRKCTWDGSFGTWKRQAFIHWLLKHNESINTLPRSVHALEWLDRVRKCQNCR